MASHDALFRCHKLNLFILILTFLVSGNTAVVAQTDAGDVPKSAAGSITFYDPVYRTASDLANILQDVYSNDLKVVKDNKKMILRGPSHMVNEAQEVLMQLDQLQVVYRVQISRNGQIPGSGKNASSQAGNHSTVATTHSRSSVQQIFLVSGGQVILQQAAQQQTLAGEFSHWISVEKEPIAQDYVKLSLQAAARSVSLAVLFHREDNGQYESVSHSVAGPLNEWLPVIPSKLPHDLEQVGAKRYTSATRNALYIRVTVVQ